MPPVSKPDGPERTPLQAFLSQWKDGCGSEACGTCKHVVHVRGAVPCDVAFLGEAPGESEDVLGYPFAGPAGHRLDAIVRAAVKGSAVAWRFGYLNLVGCVPRNERADTNGRRKAAEPSYESIVSCRPRTEELLVLCRPRLVFAVGAYAQQFTKPGYRDSVRMPPTVRRIAPIVHPAAILRANIAGRDLMTQRVVIEVRDALAWLEKDDAEGGAERDAAMKAAISEFARSIKPARKVEPEAPAF